MFLLAFHVYCMPAFHYFLCYKMCHHSCVTRISETLIVIVTQMSRQLTSVFKRSFMHKIEVVLDKTHLLTKGSQYLMPVLSIVYSQNRLLKNLMLFFLLD